MEEDKRKLWIIVVHAAAATTLIKCHKRHVGKQRENQQSNNWRWKESFTAIISPGSETDDPDKKPIEQKKHHQETKQMSAARK